ncbi:type II toxin-antitoxin system HicA family toxin [uncultured Selenomonas sp.]|uniref:type II toxin-antitoxin system HicA family toxin n=1 Tax=uncultured Selenomonas sp. TaxID=159275 RepID=UPI0028DB3457|nr:type II toxin-antitoxin system HicA family toxin [uncultured Selenomonas sp.]
MRFDEAAKILEHMGYHRSQPKRGSSHWTFRKPGTAPITIPKHEPYVKEVYIRIIMDVLNEEEG